MEQLIYFILEFFANIFDIIILYTFFGLVMKEKEISNFITISTFFLTGTLALILPKFVFSNQFLILSVSFIILFNITFLYEGKIIYKAIMTAIFFVLGAIAEVFGFFLISFFDNIFIHLQLTHELYLIFITITSRIILFPLLRIVNAKKNHKNQNIKLRYFIIILLIPFLCIVLLHFIISNNVVDNGNITFVALIPIICVLIIILIVTYLFENILYKFELERKAFQLNSELKNQQINYEKNTLFFKSIAKMTHDTNYHLQYISACIKGQQQDKALQYLEKTLYNINSSIEIVKSGNLLFDTFLSNTIGIAKEHGIKISYEIFLDNQKITMEIFDLCIVFGNALDNALEACRKVPVIEERFLNIKVTSNKDNLTIKIENSTDGNVKIEENKILSQKSNKIAHGFGLENIQNIVNKYNGELLVEVRDKKFYFAVLIPLE